MKQTTAAAPSAGSKFAVELADLIRARTGLVWLVTREEQRAERLIAEAATVAQYDVRLWDAISGWTDLAGREVPPGPQADPGAAIQTVMSARRRAIFVMRDLPAFLNDPFICRGLRNAARTLPLRAREEAGCVVVITPRSEIPAELRGSATLVELPLPDRTEVAAVLTAVLDALPEDVRASAANNGAREAAIDAAVGLAESEIQQMFQRSLVASRRIDPAKVAAEKRRAVAASGVLTWIDPDPRGLDAVGGLDALKAWLRERRAAFTPEARAYGLPAPKGALIVGVPGNGKSLTAKALASAWAMPLLRLDLGGVKSKWVGESESNLRNALKTAESVAPCVVWLDEIEKALAGATQGAADGGVSADALGAILSWMQDRTGSVFVVATANDVSSLPPELLRKGRFDEVWSVDLPTLTERGQILAAALQQFNRSETIDLGVVAGATDGFTGAEIAALVPDALYAAFADSRRPIVTGDLVAAAKRTVPLSRTAPEKISAIRRWCAERARPASIVSTATASASPRIDI